MIEGFVTSVVMLIHVVVPGDTLSGIARDYDTSVETLAQVNNIADINLIYVGDELRIERGGARDTALPQQREAESTPQHTDLSGAIARWFPEQQDKAHRVAMCESRGIKEAYNSAGYYGIWQFNLETWQSVGGVGDPRYASIDEQTKRARMLYNIRQWSPWPYCGLR